MNLTFLPHFVLCKWACTALHNSDFICFSCFNLHTLGGCGEDRMPVSRCPVLRTTSQNVVEMLGNINTSSALAVFEKVEEKDLRDARILDTFFQLGGLGSAWTDATCT